jgi:hydroxyacylglutathione hydrolase
MRRLTPILFLAAAASAGAGDLDARWSPGARHCDATPQPPLQVHRFDSRTYFLRQDLCADFEAPLMYLLIGDTHALLIDSGAVADEAAMPLAKTVAGLLPSPDGKLLPLIVVHTHRHADHRAGDAQLAELPGSRIAPLEHDDLVAFYNLPGWPSASAKIELGRRVVEVIPVPGHLDDHLLFHDATTGLVFSGDFLLPGRLLVDDIDAYRASAERAVAFLKDKNVTAVLGGHIELDAQGNLYPSGSTDHPGERTLALTRQDLEGLPAALAGFNGFYSKYPNYAIVNPVRNLTVVAAGISAVIALAVWGLWRFWKRRRKGSDLLEL